jgi:hypothetical protein
MEGYRSDCLDDAFFGSVLFCNGSLTSDRSFTTSVPSTAASYDLLFCAKRQGNRPTLEWRKRMQLWDGRSCGVLGLPRLSTYARDATTTSRLRFFPG